MKSPRLQKPSILTIAIIVTVVALLTIATLLALRYQNMKTIKSELWKTYHLNSSFDSNNNINVLAFDQQGRIWVGTNRAGLKVLSSEGEITSYITTNSELTSNLITALAIDNENRVWVGTDAGLNMLAPNGAWVTYIKENSALQHDWVEGLAIDHQNRVWVGTSYDLFALSPDGSWQAFTPPYVTGNVKAMALDSDGRVWIGTFGEPALYMMDTNGVWKSFDFHLVDNLAIDDQNRVWVSTSYDGDVVMVDADGKIKSYLGEKSYYTGSIAVDHKNLIWFEGEYGNKSGFFGGPTESYIGTLTPNGDWKALSLKNSGLPNSAGFTIAIDEQDRIWVGQADRLSMTTPDLFQPLSNLLVELTRIKWITAALFILLIVLLIMGLPQTVRSRIFSLKKENEHTFAFWFLVVAAGIIGGSFGGFLGWGVGLSIGGSMNQGLGVAIAAGIIGLVLGAIIGAVITVRIILFQRS